MTVVILFVFGAIVGSFLNVVGLRWDVGDFGGRSRCPRCDKKLQWYELIPILSFFFLRARCSQCKNRISWQYPAIEILTGLVFLSIYNLPAGEAGLQFTIYNKILLLLVFCIFIVITVYDIRHKIIPDSLVYSAILLSVVGRWLLGGSVLDWLSGPTVFTFFGLIWFLSKGKAMGFGDAKLGLAVGLLLGGAQGLSAIILAFWLGAVFGIISMIFSHKKITMKSEVPFAPFIVLGAWISLVFRLNILHVASF